MSAMLYQKRQLWKTRAAFVMRIKAMPVAGTMEYLTD
jgi:hypothetical protein